MKPVAQLELSVGGAPVALWNGNKHFVFEHLREKQARGRGGGGPCTPVRTLPCLPSGCCLHAGAWGRGAAIRA